MGDEELLQKARTSPHDWPPRQVVKLLESFEFKCWEGKDQTICYVRSHVVRKAVKLIEGLRDPRREPDA
jgi:hypothetical protein